MHHPAAIPDHLTDSLLRAILGPQAPDASPQDTSPEHLASKFNLSLAVLLDWLADPTTQARINAADTIRQLVTNREHAAARSRAIGALTSILESTADPIELRRVASLIIRATSARTTTARTTQPPNLPSSRSPEKNSDDPPRLSPRPPEAPPPPPTPPSTPPSPPTSPPAQLPLASPTSALASPEQSQSAEESGEIQARSCDATTPLLTSAADAPSTDPRPPPPTHP